MLNIHISFPQSGSFFNTISGHHGPASQRQPLPPQGQSMGGGNGQSELTQLISAILKGILQQLDGSQSHAPSQSHPNIPEHGAGHDAMKSLSNDVLGQTISPHRDGGGHVSDTTKPFLKSMGQFMDLNPDQFGTPSHHASDKSATSTGCASASSSSNVTTGGTIDHQGTGKINPFPTASSNPIVLHQPIVIKAGDTFDGHNQTYTAGSNMGDGGQSETQKPLFVLENGAKLKNVIIGQNGADGVHVKGNGEVDNVHWTNVGEDAITLKKDGNLKISNSSFQHAEDKVVQLNANGSLTLDNVQMRDFGKGVRTNGGKQLDMDIYLNHVKADGGKFNLVRSDSHTVHVDAHDVETSSIRKKIYDLPQSGTLDVF